MDIVVLPNASGKVDLQALMHELGRRQLNEVHIEAGFKLNGSLLAEGLIDELLLYYAPRLMGEGSGMFNLAAPETLSAMRGLDIFDIARVGGDVRIRARAR